MAGYGSAPLEDIREMLDACFGADKYKMVPGRHNWRVFFGQKLATLPTGEHGSRTNPDIELGHVEGFVLALGIDKPRVERHLPQLKGKLGKKDWKRSIGSHRIVRK